MTNEETIEAAIALADQAMFSADPLAAHLRVMIADLCARLRVTNDDTTRLDWLSRRPIDMIVPKSWGVSPDEKLPLREFIDAAREREKAAT